MVHLSTGRNRESYSSYFGLSAHFEKFDIQFIGETATMDYRKRFVVEPGARVRLGKIDPAFTDKHESHDTATSEIEKHVERMAKLQYLLYADGNQSLLVVLQALDAGGKDGVVRHVFSAMNPQGTWVFGFKQPSKLEATHDFVWRAHVRAPGKGKS
jgi:polyphosphate kinase 2 (PPK2 family)